MPYDSPLRNFRTPPDFEAMEAKMTLDQLDAFCEAPDHVRQMALTKPAARELLAALRAGQEPEAYQIPVRRTQRQLDAEFQTARLKRMRALDARFADARSY